MDYPDIYVCKRRLMSNDNVKHISKLKISKFPHNDNGDLICSKCSKETDYLWDINNTYLCPLCAYTRRYRLICNTCNNIIGCSSCGGNSNLMLEYDNNTLICFNSICLSSFRLYIGETLKCTCINDRVNDMRVNRELSSVIIDITTNYLGDYNKDVGVQPIKFSNVDRTRCIIHQIKRLHGYNIIYKWDVSNKRHLRSCIC